MKYLLVILLVGVLTAVAGPPPEGSTDTDRSDYRDGSAAGSADVAKGVLKYGIMGMPQRYMGDVAREALKQYGITIVFHGCIPGPRVWYNQGYLDIVRQRLTERYGFDPVARLGKEFSEKGRAKP